MATYFFISILTLLDVVPTLILPFDNRGMFIYDNTLSLFLKKTSLRLLLCY
jgi:hypothetical protein